MNCKEIKDKFPDYLIGDLDVTGEKNIKNHAATCASCREELENLTETWTKLGVLPEEQPGENLRENFYTMLESYKAGLEQKKQGFGTKKWLDSLFGKIWPRRPVFQFAFTLFLLLIGFSIGLFLPTANPDNTERRELRQEVRDLRQSAALAMLKLDSSSERIRGVSFSTQVKNPDQKTLVALLDTLNHDPNVNVRLSAVDALYLFSNEPLVKEGLIQSLSQQESPLVQIALIDLIADIREKRAVKALKELIKQQKVNPVVKKQAELSIQELI